MNKKIISIFLTFLPLSLFSFIETQIGPEIFYYHRERSTGTFQQGRLDGIRFRAERLCSFGLYLGADYFRARGDVSGENTRKNTILSCVFDEIYEGRIGMCFSPSCFFDIWFIPFIGFGHFFEINDAFPPSPLCICTTDQFNYLIAGFYSRVYSIPCFSIGFRCETMWMLDAQSQITNDPLFEDITLSIRDVPYVRLEIPLRFNPGKRHSYFSWQLTPFYEFRHFGGKDGYPFDYIDTKFQLVGGNFSILFIF